MDKNPAVKYNELTDASLTVLAVKGDEDAAADLIDRYLPLIRSRAAVFSGNSDEFEDLCQEGMIGLLVAIRSYDAAKASFSSFARICVDRVMISSHRARHRKRKIPQANVVALNESGDDLIDDIASSAADDPESIFIRREENMRLMLRVANSLSSLESKVLSLFLSGMTYDEIADQLEISAKSVDNALQRIRKKLKK